jgi:hypothetical protein
MGIYYSKLVGISCQPEVVGRTEPMRYTHSGNLEVIELGPCQDSSREWFDLSKPFPTGRMPVAALKENSGIVGIPRRSRTHK